MSEVPLQIEDLLSEREKILEEVTEIETQVSKYDTGEFDTVDLTWRRRAISARRHKERRLTVIKSEITAMRWGTHDKTVIDAKDEKIARLKKTSLEDRADLKIAKAFVLSNLGKEKLHEMYAEFNASREAVV